MPVNPVVADTFEVVVKGTIAGSVPWVNRFYRSGVLPLDQSFADDIADVIASCYDQIKGSWYTGTVATECVVTDVGVLGGAQFTSTSSFPVTGTDSTAPLPGQTAALISWTTDYRGAEGRGRTFLPGFAEGASDGNLLDAALIAQLATFVDILVDDGYWYVVSKYKGTTPATSGKSRLKPIPRVTNVTHLITGGLADTIWRTQRRRALPS